jgi:hypothetical protein
MPGSNVPGNGHWLRLCQEAAISLVHSFPAIETGDHAECRHWGMVNFGYAAETAIGHDLGMRFGWRVERSTCRSNGWNWIQLADQTRA